ncbi:MAG: chromate transporter [Clostridia bacterium]|jgi:chromate transporter|nr:chromate transporter [Clostridia bacterium]
MLHWEIYWTFFKIGAFSFGGGYGMIPLITQELVYHHGWVTMEQLVDMIAVSQMTPGPIAINIATFAGYQTGGTMGSVVATLGVVTPSALIVIAGVAYFLKHHKHPLVQAVLKGIRPVVIALIAYSGVTVAQRVLDDMLATGIFVAALLASHYYKLHPIAALGAGGFIGILSYILL